MRLQWAREHQHWTREDWARVAWSDESAIKKDSDTRKMHVWRHQDKYEKYLPRNICGKQHDGGLSQIVWKCFIGNKLGLLVFIDDKINKDVYITILE